MQGRIYHEYLDAAESADIEARIREERRAKALAKKYFNEIPCRNPAKGPNMQEIMTYYSERNRILYEARQAPRPTSHYQRSNGDILDRPREELDNRTARLGYGTLSTTGAEMDEAQLHAEAALCAARKLNLPDPKAPLPVPGAAYDKVRADDGSAVQPRGRPEPVPETKVKTYVAEKDYSREGNHYPGMPGVPPDWKPPSVAPPNMQHWCASCGFQGTRFKCGQCKDTFYCSRSCQKQHWPEHRDLCSPSIVADADREEAGIQAELAQLGWSSDGEESDDAEVGS